MDTSFSVSNKFTRRNRPDCRQGTAPGGKSFLARALFVILGLVLWLSACAATVCAQAVIEAPPVVPREITPGAPLSAAVVNQFPSHVTGGGSLRVLSVYSEGAYAWRVGDKLQLGFGLSYWFDDFHFTGLNFYAPRPWSDVHHFGGNFSLLYDMCEKWSLLFTPIFQAAGEPGAAWSRALIYGGAGAVVYRFDKDRSIGIGIGTLYNIAEISVFPFVVLNWKLTDQLRLSTPFRASPAGPGGVELTYWPIKGNKDLRIGLGATYLSKRFRLSETNSIANGIGEYDTIPVFARVSYRLLPIVDVDLYGGASVFNYMQVYDHNGGRLFHSHQNVAPFIGIGFSLNFQKFMPGTGGSS